MAKRLSKTSRGSYKLQSGEFITKTEKQKLQKLVYAINRKRKRQLEKLPNVARKKYQTFGYETDFIYRKKSARLNKFRTRLEFEQYYKNLKRITRAGHENAVLNTYRANFKSSINKVFGSSGSELIKFINSISNDELKALSLSEELSNIGYVYYEPQSAKNKLETLTREINKIRNKR